MPACCTEPHSHVPLLLLIPRPVAAGRGAHVAAKVRGPAAVRGAATATPALCSRVTAANDSGAGTGAPAARGRGGHGAASQAYPDLPVQVLSAQVSELVARLNLERGRKKEQRPSSPRQSVVRTPFEHLKRVGSVRRRRRQLLAQVRLLLSE